jgi:hypothetical protein
MAVGFPTKVNFATGDVLTAQNMNDLSGTVNLLESAQYAAGKNKIINGDFSINQRNLTTSTTSAAYGFDRWLAVLNDGTTNSYSAQTFTPGAAPVAGYEATNFARLISAGQTLSSAQTSLRQYVESVRTFAGETITVSFWAKAASGTPKVALEVGQAFGIGGSSNVDIYAGQVTLSTSWARYSLTLNVPSISGKTIGTTDSLQFNFFVSAGTNLNARTGSLGIQSNTFDFWGVQAEAGSTASPFQTATGTKQGELAACQRYYVRVTPGIVSAQFNQGFAKNTTEFFGYMPLPVQMRVIPTASDTSATFSKYQINDGITPNSVTNLLLIPGQSTQVGAFVYATVASGLTAFRPYSLQTSGTGSDAFIGFTAEF